MCAGHIKQASKTNKLSHYSASHSINHVKNGHQRKSRQVADNKTVVDPVVVAASTSSSLQGYDSNSASSEDSNSTEQHYNHAFRNRTHYHHGNLTHHLYRNQTHRGHGPKGHHDKESQGHDKSGSKVKSEKNQFAHGNRPSHRGSSETQALQQNNSVIAGRSHGDGKQNQDGKGRKGNHHHHSSENGQYLSSNSTDTSDLQIVVREHLHPIQ